MCDKKNPEFKYVTEDYSQKESLLLELASMELCDVTPQIDVCLSVLTEP
jgi:hypothetical protein